MGYTHYFQLNKTDNNIKKNFYAASVEFERLYHKMQNFNSLQLDKYSHYYHDKIEIFDGMGIGSPIITSKNIIFISHLVSPHEIMVSCYYIILLLKSLLGSK